MSDLKGKTPITSAMCGQDSSSKNTRFLWCTFFEVCFGQLQINFLFTIFFFLSTMKRGEKSHFKVLKPWSSGRRFNFLTLSKSSHNLRNFINTVHVGKNCYAYMQEKLLLEGQFSLKGFILFWKERNKKSNARLYVWHMVMCSSN